MITMVETTPSSSPETIRAVPEIENKKRPFQFSLVAKFSLMVIILMLIFLALTSAVFILFQQDTVTRDIEENGRVFAEFTAHNIYDSYLNYYTHPGDDDFSNFKNNVEPILARNKNIFKVTLVGVNGKIFFDSDEIKNGKYAGTDDRTLQDNDLLNMVKSEDVSSRTIQVKGDKEMDIVVPIKEATGDHVLSLIYYLNYETLKESTRQIYVRLAFTVIPMMVLSFLFAIPFSISVTRPIHSLTKAANVIREGQYVIHVKTESNDEIGDLAESFNQMAVQLNKTHAENEEYRRTLEQKVSDRTKELAEKLSELERLNRLMVGRELKMVELKKEITNLQAKVSGTASAAATPAAAPATVSASSPVSAPATATPQNGEVSPQPAA